MQQSLVPKSNLLKELCSAREVQNAQRLDKLPQKVWEKILDHLEEDDLFPLALSCRYFRQKQKELVAPTRQHGPESGKPRLALKTNLKRKLKEGTPASSDYLCFCSKEKVLRDHVNERDTFISRLAAYHGHLSLLEVVIKPFRNEYFDWLDSYITSSAGEFSFRQSPFSLFCI